MTGSTPSSSLSIIVPVFNEAKKIAANLDLLIQEVIPHFSNLELLVVNDGSTDQTSQVLKNYHHPQVTIEFVDLPKNQGKGFAVREGFKRARGEFILFIDGGMELHPKEIRIFFGLMELYDADVVLGSKRHPQSKIDYPWFRRILSGIYQALIRKLFDLDVTDTQVGIKLFKRDVIQKILPHLEINRYGFDLELLALAKHFGFHEFLEAPIRLDYFNFNSRRGIQEWLHVLRVGSLVLKDTWALYQKIQRINR